MKKLWLNIKAFGIIAVGVSLYAIILVVTLVSGIVGSLRKVKAGKRNG